MFKGSENDLNRLVRIAWELGLVAGNRDLRNDCSAIFNAISDHLHATGWSLHKGNWSGNVSQLEIAWVHHTSSPLFPQYFCNTQMNLQWLELIEKVIDQSALVSSVGLYEDDADEGTEGHWHALSRMIAYPDGNLEWLAFVKPSYEGAFTELERASVDALLANLNDVGVRPLICETEVPTKAGLPKRQREVLELLLQGASLKEIAADLNISRHTVNDYSKALYRHFEVSGRAELAAIFRNSAPLELSHSE
jgi:DNA-binding CsgD family transcriptional regulator